MTVEGWDCERDGHLWFDADPCEACGLPWSKVHDVEVVKRTIYDCDLERLAARLEGRAHVEPQQQVIRLPVISDAGPGCRMYPNGVQCGQPEVERLVPIYGDLPGDEWTVPVCIDHLRQHLADNLLAAAPVEDWPHPSRRGHGYPRCCAAQWALARVLRVGGCAVRRGNVPAPSGDGTYVPCRWHQGRASGWRPWRRGR